MKFKITMRSGRIFAANAEFSGVFELISGAYTQHRGTGQTPVFRTTAHFRAYVSRMLRPITESSGAAYPAAACLCQEGPNLPCYARRCPCETCGHTTRTDIPVRRRDEATAIPATFAPPCGVRDVSIPSGGVE